MKVFGKWLVVQVKAGKRGIITSAHTKKECVELLQCNARQIDKNTWSDGGDSIFIIEKNATEYR